MLSEIPNILGTKKHLIGIIATVGLLYGCADTKPSASKLPTDRQAFVFSDYSATALGNADAKLQLFGQPQLTDLSSKPLHIVLTNLMGKPGIIVHSPSLPEPSPISMGLRPEYLIDTHYKLRIDVLDSDN